MEHKIEAQNLGFQILRPLNTQTQSVAGSFGARSCSSILQDAGQGRQGLRIMTRTQAQRIEFRAKLSFHGAVERQSGKLRLKVRCMDLIHRAGKL